MLKTSEMTEKIKTSQKIVNAFTPTHDTLGVTRNIHELFLNGTLGPKLHLTEICV